MYRRSVLFCTFFCFFCNAFTQEKKIALEDSISKYFFNKPDIANVYLIDYLNENIKTKNIENQTIAYSSLAVNQDLKGNIDSTLYYYQKALSISTKPKDIIQTKFTIGLTYEKLFNYDEALKNYSECLDLSKRIGEEKSIINIKLAIAKIKSKIGKPEETLELLKEVYSYYKATNDLEIKFARKDLAEAYLNTGNDLNALSLIEEGLKEAKLSKDYQILYYLYDLKFKYLYEKTKITEAKTYIDSAKTCALKLGNLEFLDQVNFNLAQVYSSQSKDIEAIEILKNTLNNSRTKTPEEEVKYYRQLGIAYKEIDSIALSAKYNRKYIDENEKLSKKRMETLDKIHNIKVQEDVKELQKQKRKNLYLIVFISGLLISAIFLTYKYLKNKKQNQSRFESLLQKIKRFEEKQGDELNYKDNIQVEAKKTDHVVEHENTIVTPNVILNKPKGYVIHDNKIEELLNKVHLLEKSQYFLRQDCTLPNMAKKLKTNTSYLSKVINTHLNKSFKSYINELRINYAILELKNNKRFRAYSVKGIAQEIGYRNANSFSKSFKDITGIKPSLFINKIKDLQE